MLCEAEMLKPACLILWKTDRLSRDRYDSVGKGHSGLVTSGDPEHSDQWT